MKKKIADFISGHPKLIVTVALLLLIPSVIGFFNTGVNYDILSYLPEDLNSVQGMQVLDETFHNAASSFLIIEDADEKEALALKEKIEQVEGVSAVLSVDSIADPTIPKEILPDILTSIFYSADGSSTMMMVQYGSSSSSDETMAAISQIKKILTKNSFISGLSVINVETKDMADKQAPVFVAVAIAVALLAMMLTMKSYIQPLILLASLMLAVVYNMGSNFIFGSISYITQSIGAILQLGVTMDYSVFLIDRYDEELLRSPNDKRAAMSRAIIGTFDSLISSSLTTVFGFLALCFMSFTLGADIGLVMVKGVILGVLTVVTILPALVLLCDRPIHRYTHRELMPSFSGINGFIIKHRRVFAVVFILLLVPVYILSEQAPVYYDMTKAMPQDMQSITALNKLKDDFNMASTHFVITDAELPAEQTAKMTDELSDIDGITGVLSLGSLVGGAIPTSILPDEIKAVCVAGGKQLMMINSAYATSSDEATRQIEQLEEIVFRYDPTAYVTGEAVMTYDLIDVTSRDFVVTSIISILAVAILIGISLKSFSMPVLLVAAIELAIMLNKSCSFLLGSEMSFISPTVISCVQLGATVDYAILLSTRFKEELKKGKNKIEAMKTAANESDRSIFRSALVFFGATFAVYLACDIQIIREICALLARGAVISAAVIIFFLTPTLLVCEKFIGKTSFGWPSKRSKQ